MAKAHPILADFTAGEWSPLMQGHVTLERRQSAALLIQNLIPVKQGPMIRRGGTKYVKEVKTSSIRTHLMKFQFSTTQAYQIEVGDLYFRFYRDNAIITLTAQDITNITRDNPATVTYSGSDTYAAGNEVYISGVTGMTEINGRFFKIGSVDVGANTFTLQDMDGVNFSTNTFTPYVSGGTAAEVYEITTPYNDTDLYDSNNLFKIRTAQSADVLYIAHPDYQPRVLTRTGHTAWTLSSLTFDDGPYLDTNTTETTITLSGTSGSVTVTASAVTGINGDTGFQTTDVGRLIRWKDPANNWTWLLITAWTSTTVVTATISGPNASAGTATVNWRLGVYSDTTGWPSVVKFHENRLVFAGNADYPDRFDMSRTGGYGPTEALFAPSDANGTVTDDAAVTGTLQSGEVNAIQWLSSTDKGLVIGTVDSEWLVRASNQNEVITPTNRKADRISSTGSAAIEPISAETGTVFIQNARRKVFDVIYSFESDSLKPRDLTLTSEHITKNGIIGMAYQQEPVNVVWAVRNDGLLVGQTYYPDQAVFGWHRHIIGGDFGSGDAVVECASVIPSADGSRDELWLIVKRTIDGDTRRYVEYMTRYYEDDIDVTDIVQTDCTATYDSTATGTVTGLYHLEGQTVRVLVDGRSHPDLTVSSGSITLSNNVTGSTIQIGLANTWAYKSMQMEAGAADGTAQGKTKRVDGFVARLLNTLGFQYGPDSGTLDEYDFNQGQAYDDTESLFSGDTPFLAMPGGYGTDGFIYLTDDGVFPCTILSIMPKVTTQDR